MWKQVIAKQIQEEKKNEFEELKVELRNEIRDQVGNQKVELMNEIRDQVGKVISNFQHFEKQEWEPETNRTVHFIHHLGMFKIYLLIRLIFSKIISFLN